MKKYIKPRMLKVKSVYTMFTFKKVSIVIEDVVVESYDLLTETVIVRALCDTTLTTLTVEQAENQLYLEQVGFM